MNRWVGKLSLLMALAGLAGGLGGCASAVVGAGATVGIAVAQERSVGQAVDDAKILTDINHRLLDN